MMARRRRVNSNMRLRIEGVENVTRTLSRANDEIKQELRDLISEAAEIVFREADARVPIGKTHKTRYSLRMTVGVNRKGNFYANVAVGARRGETTKESAFYVTFYELGTSRQPPRPFLRPSLDKSRTKVRRFLVEELRQVIARIG